VFVGVCVGVGVGNGHVPIKVIVNTKKLLTIVFSLQHILIVWNAGVVNKIRFPSQSIYSVV